MSMTRPGLTVAVKRRSDPDLETTMDGKWYLVDPGLSGRGSSNYWPEAAAIITVTSIAHGGR